MALIIVIFEIEVSFDTAEIIGKIKGDKISQKELNGGKLVNVQCFPLYSILLAHGRTSIDFLSLDIEGHELQVLKTIPWNKVNITVKKILLNAKKNIWNDMWLLVLAYFFSAGDGN